MWISGDQGQSWSEFAGPGSVGRVYASVVELAGGRLAAFFRSRAADRIYVSRSGDYGRTWTPPARTALPNNNASIQARRLSSGAIALVYNQISANDDPTKTVWPPTRYPVTIALSDDGGETWPYRRHLDRGDDFDGDANLGLNRRVAYPCLLQAHDGRLHVCYSYRNRQYIKHVCISEEWVRAGREWLVGRPG